METEDLQLVLLWLEMGLPIETRYVHGPNFPWYSLKSPEVWMEDIRNGIAQRRFEIGDYQQVFRIKSDA